MLARRWISASAACHSFGDQQDAESTGEAESMHFDVLIVGAGPAGLSAAIRLKQRGGEIEQGGEGNAVATASPSVCVIEKGSEVGAHILSGNVFQPTALDELIPDWRNDPTCPVGACPVTADRFYFLAGQRSSLRLPTPLQMRNRGKNLQNYVISLSEMTRWLASKAEEMGVEIYPGFAAAELLYSDNSTSQTSHSNPFNVSPSAKVIGVRTNDVGVGRDGRKKTGVWSPGMRLTAKATLLAEGCRGSLSEQVISRYGLRDDTEGRVIDPQTYALGIKEVWEVDPEKHRPGTVWHTIGWPLPWDTYGGGWVYHMKGGSNLVSIGLVVALDYSNPYLSPYNEFQKFKTHTSIRQLLEGGTCIQYGARSLNEGGWQSMPKLTFPGGALIGDAAGFLNVPKIKGSHTAMKSGMLAADAVFEGLQRANEQQGKEESSYKHVNNNQTIDLSSYEAKLRNSWVHDELWAVRNIRPAFSRFGGLPGGMLHAALDTYIFWGKAPWTLRTRAHDREAMVPAASRRAPEYPKPDGRLTFDIPTSLHRSGTNHDHDQPCHLKLRNPKLPSVVNVPIYGGPEARYCPAGVYEYVPVDSGASRQLQINAQNCLHCKACDIKDPSGNIVWTPPEGGGGPGYTVM